MSELIYDSTRNGLEDFLFKLQMLQDQGVSVCQMPDVVFERLQDLIDEETSKKLEIARQQLKEICQTE